MDDDTVAYECGVDIHSTFQFTNNDIVLVKYEDNLVQAIVNKLNTNIDEMDLFYEDYGSILTTFLGWKAKEETIHYMETEVSAVLSKEPRLSAYEVDIEYAGDGTININLVLHTTTAEVVEANLVLGVDGIIEVETDDDLDVETEEE